MIHKSNEWDPQNDKSQDDRPGEKISGLEQEDLEQRSPWEEINTIK